MNLKEKYFEKKNIYKTSKSFLKEIEHLRKKHKINLKTKNIALLILDMQRYFLDKSSHAFIPSAPEIVENIKKIENIFLEKNLPVILTKHINTSKNAKMMKLWWKDLIKEESIFSEIIPELMNKKAKIIKKSQYDAFYGTELEKFLKRKRIKQIIITGVMTHLCCETTARSAFVRNFEVFFVIDGTATYNRKFHKATLINLAHGFAIPLLTEEIIKNFEKI